MENIKVALLTDEQANLLSGQLYTTDTYFNPIKDADGNWIISLNEISLCEYDNYAWLNELPKIDYKPIITII